jgi:hypothetical protein
VGNGSGPSPECWSKAVGFAPTRGGTRYEIAADPGIGLSALSLGHGEKRDVADAVRPAGGIDAIDILRTGCPSPRASNGASPAQDAARKCTRRLADDLDSALKNAGSAAWQAQSTGDLTPTPGRASLSPTVADGIIEPGAGLALFGHCRSVCHVGPKQASRRSQEDPQIQPDRPVLDVIEIVLEPSTQLCRGVNLSPETVDLGPSGDAGRQTMTSRIAVNDAGEAFLAT